MVATLFLTFADIEMSKVVTGLMNRDSGLDMVELRAQIRSLESSTWYKGTAKGTESAKLAGATGGNLPTTGEKWCTGCQKPTHNTVDCYGICRWCNGRGHKSEHCRFRKDAEAKKEEQLKASRAAEIKKKKKAKSKAAKKNRKGGANKASSSVDLPGAAGTTNVSDSSSSEERSPMLETGARSKRVNFLGAARKATVFKYPTLGMIHEAVEDLPVEEVREQVSRACAAKASESSPVLEGILYKSKNDHSVNSTERCIADTGCSFSIINNQIVQKLGLKVRPFKQKIAIVEA